MIGIIIYVVLILLVLVAYKYDDELRNYDFDWVLFMAIIPNFSISICLIELYKLIKFLTIFLTLYFNKKNEENFYFSNGCVMSNVL